MTKIHEINVHEKQVLYHKGAQDGIFLQVFTETNFWDIKEYAREFCPKVQAFHELVVKGYVRKEEKDEENKKPGGFGLASYILLVIFTFG